MSDLLAYFHNLIHKIYKFKAKIKIFDNLNLVLPDIFLDINKVYTENMVIDALTDKIDVLDLTNYISHNQNYLPILDIEIRKSSKSFVEYKDGLYAVYLNIDDIQEDLLDENRTNNNLNGNEKKSMETDSLNKCSSKKDSKSLNSLFSEIKKLELTRITQSKKFLFFNFPSEQIGLAMILLEDYLQAYTYLKRSEKRILCDLMLNHRLSLDENLFSTITDNDFDRLVLSFIILVYSKKTENFSHYAFVYHIIDHGALTLILSIELSRMMMALNTHKKKRKFFVFAAVRKLIGLKKNKLARAILEENCLPGLVDEEMFETDEERSLISENTIREDDSNFIQVLKNRDGENHRLYKIEKSNMKELNETILPTDEVILETTLSMENTIVLIEKGEKIHTFEIYNRFVNSKESGSISLCLINQFKLRIKSSSSYTIRSITFLNLKRKKLHLNRKIKVLEIQIDKISTDHLYISVKSGLRIILNSNTETIAKIRLNGIKFKISLKVGNNTIETTFIPLYGQQRIDLCVLVDKVKITSKTVLFNVEKLISLIQKENSLTLRNETTEEIEITSFHGFFDNHIETIENQTVQSKEEREILKKSEPIYNSICEVFESNRTKKFSFPELLPLVSAQFPHFSDSFKQQIANIIIENFICINVKFRNIDLLFYHLLDIKVDKTKLKYELFSRIEEPLKLNDEVFNFIQAVRK